MNGDVDDAIADLQQRVAALEQAPPPPSTLQPNVLTDVAGKIGAQFSGVVSAQGLYLPGYASDAPKRPETDSRVNWTDSGLPAGALLAYLEAIYNASAPLIPTSLRAFAQRGSASAGALILDSNGDSSFPQLQASHVTVIDDNGGSFYDTGTVTVADGVLDVLATFTTDRAGWSVLVPIGALFDTGSSLTPCQWIYSFTSPDQVTIELANNSGFTGTYRWLGLFIGH